MYHKAMRGAVIALFLALTVSLCLVACSDTSGNPKENGTGDLVTDVPTETPTDPVTEPATEPEETVPGGSEPEVTEPTETEPVEVSYFSRLTGEPTTKELYEQRPAAIMINNVQKACPQIGVGEADVIFECMCEGGVTRLMMLKTDYTALDVIGSIRSSREYFVDYAQAFDALYVHAGGSDQAYAEMKARRIDHVDFVNGRNPAGTFYQDPDRRVNMGYEHSLMTTGEAIAKDFVYNNLPLTHGEDTVDSFRFVPYGTVNVPENGMDAPHVQIPYTASHYPQFVYHADTQTYYRYQFKGVLHIDGATNEPLTFTNVLILSCPHVSLNDSKYHIDVKTEGEGDGYYITMGKCVPIRWEKETVDSPLSLTYADGTPVLLNCGKTFVNVVSPNAFSKITMDASGN